MYQTKRRWELIKSYIGWEDYLGSAILLMGVLGFIPGPIPFIPGWTDTYNEIRAELIGIGITVLIIDNANEAIKRREQTREEKKRLILHMGSPDNAYANEAVRQLSERGWISDGSLRGANLEKANLEGANLARVFYMRTRDGRRSYMGVKALVSADLGGAILEEANLKGTYLAGANLERTHLWKANLELANLEGTNLRNADLRESNLNGANLKGANLEGARVTDEQLASTKSLEGAIMPDGTLYNDEDSE